MGRLYRYTTNPVEATGDGIAMAARAGALLADMEFVQFHPTALAIGRDPMPLVTEAVRGEGAMLVNDLGERFMPAIHPDAELAPRDVVARAIFEQQQRGRTVGLDARSAIGARFPRSLSDRVSLLHGRRHRSARAKHSGRAGRALSHGRHRRRRMGAHLAGAPLGVRRDERDRRARRQPAREQLVARGARLRFARRHRRRECCARGSKPLAATLQSVRRADPRGARPERPRAQAISDLRNVMYSNVGLVRNDVGLREALARIAELEAVAERDTAPLRNLLVVGRLIAEAALARHESRGSHYRSDYPRDR